MLRTSRISHFWRDLTDGLGSYLKPAARREPVADRGALRGFIETRASYVAQTSLYGYLRTRAGMRYPELFTDDPFVVSLNVAKWHVWLACVSDLAVYSGGLLAAGHEGPAEAAGALIRGEVGTLLDGIGVPEDAGPEYPAHAGEVLARLAACDFAAVTDDEGPFSESPGALVTWAPIIDELKQLDQKIVRNSVRFRWQDVRRDLRAMLDVAGVMGDSPPSPGG